MFVMELTLVYLYALSLKAIIETLQLLFENIQTNNCM